MDYDIQLVVIDAKRPAWETSPVVRYGTTPKSVKRTATFFGVLIAIVAISALFITAL